MASISSCGRYALATERFGRAPIQEYGDDCQEFLVPRHKNDLPALYAAICWTSACYPGSIFEKMSLDNGSLCKIKQVWHAQWLGMPNRVALHSAMVRLLARWRFDAYTLYSYPELFGVADNNAYGLKVFAFLRLNRVPFTHEHFRCIGGAALAIALHRR
jgi:hypothetical protein